MHYLLILNTCAYLVYAIWAYRKGAKCLGFIGSVWTFSTFCSIIYAWLFEEFFSENLCIEAFPLFYIFVGFFLCTIPLSKLGNDNKLTANNPSVLYFISIAIILVAIPPFASNIAYALSNLGSGGEEVFADNYADKESTVLSPTLVRFNTIVSLFRAVTPVLFFYMLEKSKNRILLLGLLIAIFEPSLNNLNNGSRFVIVVDTLYLLSLYFIIGKSLSPDRKKLLKKSAVILGSLAGALFVAITIFRFSDSADVNNENPLLLGLTRYAGEGFVDFSNELWEKCHTTDGENAFTVFLYLFGDESSPFRDPDVVSSLSNVRGYIFYTYVGDYYMDFGAEGAFVLILIQSFLMWIFVRNYKKNNTIYNLIWISWLLRIIVPGFTYYAYLNNAYEVITTPLINIFIFFFCRHSESDDESVATGKTRQLDS